MWEAEEQGLGERQAGAEARARAPTGRGEPSSLRRQVVEMQALFVRGAPVDEVARRHGVTRARVLELLGRHGLDPEVVAGAVEAARLRREELGRRREIILAFESLGDERRAAERLGLPLAAVEEAVAYDLRDLRARREHRASAEYPDEELIESLREAAARLGGSPNASDYLRVAHAREIEDGSPRPEAPTITRRFGSWAEALRRAELPPHSRPRPIAPERCIAAVREVAGVLGRAPTRTEYKKHAKESDGALPSDSMVYQRCGRWPEVLRMAGLRAHE